MSVPVEEVLDLIDKGVSRAEIARRYGVTRQTISFIAVRHGKRASKVKVYKKCQICGNDILNHSSKYCGRECKLVFYRALRSSYDTKTCRKCGETKPIDEFVSHKRKCDGSALYTNKCKKCHNLLTAKRIKERRQDGDSKLVEIDRAAHRRYYLSHKSDLVYREKQRQRAKNRFRKRYQSDPEFRKKINERSRERYHRRKKVISSQKRERYHSDFEYREMKKQKARERYHRRKATNAHQP